MAETAAVQAKEPEEKQPTAAEISKAKKAAQEHFASLKKTALMQRTSTMKVGRVGYRMKVAGEFEVLGMDEIEVMQAVNMERSTWFRALQIAGGYNQLPERDYLRLYSGKAYIGLKLPESERLKKHWLDRMSDPKVSTEDFETAVLKKLESGEVKQDATSVEDRTWLKVRLYQKDYDACEKSLNAFCSEHDLGDNWGQALVIILTDKATERLSEAEVKMLFALKDAFKENMPELLATIKLLKEAKRPAEERVDTFERVGLKFVKELSKAAGVKV